MKSALKLAREAEEVRGETRESHRVVLPLNRSGKRPLLRVELADSYRDFFKFSQTPFSVSPNPEFFYPSRSHAEALDHLRYGIYEGLGFTMLTGEPGSGKTMLSRYFFNQAGEDLRMVEIADPRLSPRELLLAILESLGVSRFPQEDLTERKLSQQLQELLLLAHGQFKKVVILLDEAQGLDFESLEGIRLLSNLETENQKLVQIVLFGQLELQEKLREKRMRQLDQRILVRYQLLPLELQEIQPYIEHQLTAANVEASVEFTPQSAGKIYEISGGLPRMVNVLCERAMMSAFVQGTTKIQAENVLEAWESLHGIAILERKRV